MDSWVLILTSTLANGKWNMTLKASRGGSGSDSMARTGANCPSLFLFLFLGMHMKNFFFFGRMHQ